MSNLTTVYKKNGKSLEINDNSLKFIGKLGLSLEEPKAAEKKAEKKSK